MNIREALIQQSPSLALQRAASDEIARLDARVRELEAEASARASAEGASAEDWVRAFDGREAHGIWPNGSHCGPFLDEEVEFIRISRKQLGYEYADPRDEKPIPSQGT